MRKQKGFSLIELLIVVAIILIIAAIAIPNLLKSRIAANESSAVASVRTLATSEITYFTRYNSYATTLTQLGQPGGEGLIDNQLTTGLKSGYSFTLTATSSLFTIVSVPQTSGTTGNRSFCAMADAVVRVSQTATITCNATATAL